MIHSIEIEIEENKLLFIFLVVVVVVDVNFEEFKNLPRSKKKRESI